MENTIRLYEKSKKEIERFGYYLNNDIPIEEVQKIRSYILNNKQLMKLYGEKSAEELMVSYLKEIEHIIVDLAAKHDYQYLANILEYFRFMCMRENIEGAIPGIEFYENLSDSKFSSILLGKASAEGQVAAAIDLLSNRMKASMCTIGFVPIEETNNTNRSYACLALSEDTGKHYVDIFRYAGKMKANPTLVAKNYVDEIYPIVLDDRSLRDAKKRVSKVLIKKLKINKILESLNLEGLSEKEKNDKFIEYIKTNQDDYEDIRVNANTIVVNGHLMEVSRLLELFYIASKIRYRLIDNQKENSTFEVILDNEHTIVSLKEEDQKKLIK